MTLQMTTLALLHHRGLIGCLWIADRMEKSNCSPKKQQQEGSWRGSYMRNNSQLQVTWQWCILELGASESEWLHSVLEKSLQAGVCSLVPN